MRKADNLTNILCAVVMKSGNLNVLESSGRLQACIHITYLEKHQGERSDKYCYLYECGSAKENTVFAYQGGQTKSHTGKLILTYLKCKETAMDFLLKYYTSVNNTIFTLYTMVYMSGRHVST